MSHRPGWRERPGSWLRYPTRFSFGLTEGALIAAELATVVIGGLFSSTLLTLLIVPVMYSLFDRLTRTGRRQAKEAAPAGED